MGRGLRPPRNPKPKEAACFPSYVDASGHEETPPRRGTHSPHNFPLRRHKNEEGTTTTRETGPEEEGPRRGNPVHSPCPPFALECGAWTLKAKQKQRMGLHTFIPTHKRNAFFPLTFVPFATLYHSFKIIIFGSFWQVQCREKWTAKIGTENTVHPIPVCIGILS